MQCCVNYNELSNTNSYYKHQKDKLQETQGEIESEKIVIPEPKCYTRQD